MPITDPDSFDRPIVSATGTLTDARQILTTLADRESDANTDIVSLLSQVLALQQGQGTPASLGAALQDFRQHLTVNHVSGAWGTPANPTSHRGTLTRIYASHWTEDRTGATPFAGNSFEDLADPTVSESGDNHYYSASNKDDASLNTLFPGKQSYFTGRQDISGAPLTNTFSKVIGFSHHIAHALPASDTPLLRLGSREIIGVDSQGLYYLQGNSDGTLASATFNQRLFESGGTGEFRNTIVYLRGTGVQTVQLDVPANNPAGDPITFPLSLTLRIKRTQNGEATTVVTDSYTITDRNTDQSQTSQVVSVPTLPSGSANETLTFSYNGTTHVLTVGTTGISTNTTNDVSQIAFEVTYNDSQSINDSTTSTKQRFATQHDSLGNTIDMVLLFEPTNANETSADKFMSMKIVIDGYQENTEQLNFRASAFGFGNPIFGPDSGDNVAIANIQIYEYDNGGNAFNTPTHANLYAFYQQRNAWFGLFEAAATAYRNYEQNAGLILTRQAGSTINVIDRLDGIQVDIIHESVNLGTGAGGLISSIQLPANYTDFDFVYIAEYDGTGPTWDHTAIIIRLLSQTLVGAGDNMRPNTKREMNWTVGTRTLSLESAAQEMAIVALVKLGA